MWRPECKRDAGEASVLVGSRDSWILVIFRRKPQKLCGGKTGRGDTDTLHMGWGVQKRERERNQNGVTILI